jgi:hypothetical protein
MYSGDIVAFIGSIVFIYILSRLAAADIDNAED